MPKNVLNQFNAIVASESPEAMAAKEALKIYQDLLETGAKDPVSNTFLQNTKGDVALTESYAPNMLGFYYRNLDKVTLNYAPGYTEPKVYFDALVHELQHRADAKDNLPDAGFEQAKREYFSKMRGFGPIVKEERRLGENIKKSGLSYGPRELTAFAMAAMRDLPGKPQDAVLDLIEQHPDLFAILYKNRAIPGMTSGAKHYRGYSEFSPTEKLLYSLGMLDKKDVEIPPRLPPAALKRIEERKQAKETQTTNERN